MSDITATLSFETIVKDRDATVRITDDNLIYAVDLVMVVTGQSRDDAGKVLRRLSDDIFHSDKMSERQLSKRGGAKTKLISFKHALELIMVLPGKIAKETRAQFADVIHRYMAGDPSLAAEIEANAESSDPVNQFARATLGEDLESKKRRLELEDLEIQERRLALEERKRKLRQSELEMPLHFMVTCNKVAESMGGWDQRDQIRHKAMMSNYVDLVYKNSAGVAAITDSDLSPPAVPQYISIPMVVNSMGVKGNLSFSRIGKIASDLFLEEHGQRPGEYYGKHGEINAQGILVNANDYRKEDEPLLRRAVKLYLDETEQKKKAEQRAKARRSPFSASSVASSHSSYHAESD